MNLYFAVLILVICYANGRQTIVQESSIQKKNHPQFADTIYHNGDIITMDQKHFYVAFVAVKNGTIIKVSPIKSHMMLFIGPHTKIVNLHGKTLLPGFIDPHSHFSTTSIILNQGFDLSSPPFGTVTSIKDIIANVKKYIEQSKLPAGQKINGLGYSDLSIIEKRHPTRFQLDAISTVHPIFLKHFSCHVYAVNSLALQLLGYNDSTPNPAGGGVIDRYPNGTITGVLRQTAIVPILNKFETGLSDLTPQQIRNTANHYFGCGVTTAHDMLFTLSQPKAYSQLGDSLPIEVNGYSWVASDDLSNFYYAREHYSTSKFKVNGVKFIFDGSIQAHTALLTAPYWVTESQTGQNLQNYTYDSSRSCSTQNCGSDSLPNKQAVREMFLYCYTQGIDVLAHCNGDRAADNFLSALQWVRNNTKVKKDTRFIMIHAQTLREDQLKKMAELNAHPSFFVLHIYFWGDVHYKLFLGPERANRMNPAKSAANKKLIYTLHNDSPAVLMGEINGINTFLKILETSMTRKTSSGRILGPQQRLSVYEALKGVTINAAWQASIQGTKGSITTGKVADFVILPENPLKGNGEKLSSLKVVTTIVRDKVVFGGYPKELEEQRRTESLSVDSI